MPGIRAVSVRLNAPDADEFSHRAKARIEGVLLDEAEERAWIVRAVNLIHSV